MAGLVVFGWKDTDEFFSLSGGFFPVLALEWVGFLFWGCFWVVGEDTLEDTGVFFASSFVDLFGHPEC